MAGLQGRDSVLVPGPSVVAKASRQVQRAAEHGSLCRVGDGCPGRNSVWRIQLCRLLASSGLGADSKIPFFLWSESNAQDRRRGHAVVELSEDVSFCANAADSWCRDSSAREYLRALELTKSVICTAPNAVDNDLFGARVVRGSPRILCLSTSNSVCPAAISFLWDAWCGKRECLNCYLHMPNWTKRYASGWVWSLWEAESLARNWK